MEGHNGNQPVISTYQAVQIYNNMLNYFIIIITVASSFHVR